MVRRSFFMQGAGESGNDDDLDDFGGGDFAPTPRQAVASGQALGPPSPSAETSEWTPQPQANPFAPSAPLPTGPQPTSHPWSPPEQEMGPPSNPEYNPLAGLLAPNLPAYAQEGAQPARQPGDASYLAEMEGDDDLPAPGSQAEYELMQEGFGNSPYPPGEQFRQHLNQADPQPGYMENVQAITEGIRNDPNFSPAPTSSGTGLDFSGGSLGGPNPWDRTTPPPPPEEEEEDDGGGFWDTLNDAGQWAIDRVSNLNPIRPPVLRPGGSGGLYNANPAPELEDQLLTGTVIRTIDDARTLGGLGIQFGNALATNPTSVARTLGSAAQAIEDDPGVITDVGGQVASQMWQDFLEHPEDAGIGAAITALTGGGFVAARLAGRWGRAGAAVATHADDVAEAAVPVSRTLSAAEGVADAAEAAAPAARNLPGVSDVAGPTANVAADAVDAQHAANAAYHLPDIGPAVRGAPDMSGPQYQLPDAPATRNLLETPDAPQYQLPEAPPAVVRHTPSPSGAPDMSGPRYQLPDANVNAAQNVADVAEDLVPAARHLDPALGGRASIYGDEAADVAEDAADVGRTLSGNDARLVRNVEKRLNRRSNLQPSNIARRIVGAEQQDLRYSWGQRQMTKLGDRIAGGPGTEGSPNFMRQYIRSRLNRTETMPEFPEGTNRGLQMAERANWRYREMTRPLRRAENAADAVGDVHDAAEFARNPLGALGGWDTEAPVGGSIYGDEDVITASPRGFRRPTNPRFAAAQTPASQAYGQSPYTMGRGYSGSDRRV